ncbi:hypothetical protein ES703_69348 [subsurface metagenome]
MKILLYEGKPGDVILMRSEETGFYRRLKDWLLGSQWGHVAIFYDYTKRGLPLVVESIGRGVMIRSLLASDGRYSLVLRHKNPDIALAAAKRAERLADNPGSWYDYWAIPRFVLPRLVWLKLTGRRCGFGYRHNPHFICSELVNEAFDRIIPGELVPPLPHDFLAVKDFQPAEEGQLLFTVAAKRRRD